MRERKQLFWAAVFVCIAQFACLAFLLTEQGAAHLGKMGFSTPALLQIILGLVSFLTLFKTWVLGEQVFSAK